MNIMSAAVAVDPGFGVAGTSLHETFALAGFVVVGLILLFAGGRLCRRHGRALHASHAAHARYTSPRL
jgi:hypothetical protein